MSAGPRSMTWVTESAMRPIVVVSPSTEASMTMMHVDGVGTVVLTPSFVASIVSKGGRRKSEVGGNSDSSSVFRPPSSDLRG